MDREWCLLGFRDSERGLRFRFPMRAVWLASLHGNGAATGPRLDQSETSIVLGFQVNTKSEERELDHLQGCELMLGTGWLGVALKGHGSVMAVHPLGQCLATGGELRLVFSSLQVPCSRI